MHDIDRDREKRARAAVWALRRKWPGLFTHEGNEAFYGTRMEAADDETLAELAWAGEKQARGILRERVRLAYEAAQREGRDVSLHPRVVMLAVEVFCYGSPKAASGPKPTQTGLRDTMIVLMVKAVHEHFGFPLFAQPEHRDTENAPMTCHRLVGEELGLDERTIERIWGARTRR
jgi:hypothetical protein